MMTGIKPFWLLPVAAVKITTRAIISAIQNGYLKDVATTKIPGLNLEVPTEVHGVDSKLLVPRDTWANGADYDATAANLISQFVNNFTKFEGVDEKIVAAGPQL